MPFFACSFVSRGVPALAYATWSTLKPKDWALQICLSQDQASLFGTSHEGKEKFEALVKTLPPTSAEEPVHFLAPLALIFGEMIVALSEGTFELPMFQTKPLLTLLRDPVQFEAPAILGWGGSTISSEVAILYSKVQARNVLGRLGIWMPEDARTRLRAHIRDHWACPEDSATPAQIVRGHAAQLIVQAALHVQIQDELKRQKSG